MMSVFFDEDEEEEKEPSFVLLSDIEEELEIITDGRIRRKLKELFIGDKDVPYANFEDLFPDGGHTIQ